MMDPLMAMQRGIMVADGTDKAKERADVARWWQRICTTLAFDANARRMYVRSRRYARGDSGFAVDANIVGTNIDILESFIYAKNPDIDVTPAKAVDTPVLESMIDAAMLAAEEDPEIAQQVSQAAALAAMQALVSGQDPQAAGTQVQMEVKQALVAQKAQDNLVQIKDTYSKLRREAKQFAETLELVISRFWVDGRLKDRGRPWVRSALTIGPGVLKASWQERTAPSPETTTAINDLVANLERVQSLQLEIEDEAAGADLEAKTAELHRQLAALKGQAEEIITRGFVIDLVGGQNFLVAPGYRIADHMDAPWNAERIPMPLDDIFAKFRLTKEQQAKVTKYTARKPMMQQAESANASSSDDIDPKLAEEFVQGEPATVSLLPGQEESPTAGAGSFGMVWEIWDRDSNGVLTLVEGYDCWAKPAWIPPTTTRFYPYFLFCCSEIDGQRHPQSPVERSAKLVDEYNRIGSAEAQHRRRIIPKTAFNAGAMSPEEARRLEKGVTQEMVPIKLTNPAASLSDILFPVAYSAIDVNLYDRSRINQEIERIWGVQEALGGSIQVAKTATEADIQQQGFQARTGSRRDAIEDTLSHLALYTAEVARAFLDFTEVKDIAGPNAYWPPYEGPKDLRRMVNVEIRAGTTGKPNTKSERESWSVLLPHLTESMGRYAELTGASPLDLAESIKKLARLTAERAGDRIDLDSLFPPPGQGPMPPPEAPPPAPPA